jgi:hypothetical protein
MQPLKSRNKLSKLIFKNDLVLIISGKSSIIFLK